MIILRYFAVDRRIPTLEIGKRKMKQKNRFFVL